MEYIVIPMLGKSKRFKGINKECLQVNGKTIFMHSMESIVNEFKDSKWVFIISSDKYEKVGSEMLKFINDNKLDVVIEFLNEETSGQAESVYKGMRFLDDSKQVYIFNIDTMIKGFKLRNNSSLFYTFKSDKKSLSYVCEKTKIVNEKQSNEGLSSCGLYAFKSLKEFNHIFKEHANDIKRKYDETYIAPMYNYIDFEIESVDEVVLLGTPEEVKEYERKANWEWD